ncbi:oligosaccharide flippase family protein [Emticicia sp. SJ17W-69]|uniref:oligosaccharide flippase family protein n=1 Tax=Emticicia sp. SJ17W-69 TaxID=3421657 RepID=UPI003EB72C93
MINLQSILLKLKNKHFLSLVGNGSMSVLAMVTVGILLRFMHKDDVGYWFFFQSVFVLLDTFRTGFLQVAMIKFYTGAEKNRADAVLGSVWFLSLLITSVLIVINLGAVFFLPYIQNFGIVSVIQWFGITFLLTLPSAIASWILQSDQRFDKLLLLRIINQGTFIVMVLGIIFFKKLSLDLVLITNATSAGLVSLYCIAQGWTRIRTFTKRTKESILELFHFGKYSVGTTISTNLLRSSDTFIIMFVLGAAGPAAVAMFTIPMRLMEIIEIPLRAFLSTGMPSMSEAFNKGRKEEVVAIMQKYAGTLTLALFPVSILAILLADVAITLLGGSQYSGTNAVSVYRIFMSFAMFFPIDRFLGVTLDIIHQPRINFYKVLVMLFTNVLFDFIGIHLFGNINGVALATLFTFLSGVFFGYFWLKKYLDFTIFGFFTVGFGEIKMMLHQFLSKRKTA